MIPPAGQTNPTGHRESDEGTVHFRPHRRRYTPPNALMTLSRFAPMIDMSFLLLIFFLTTTRFALPEGLMSSPMPREGGSRAGAPAVALPLSPIVIRLERTGPAHEDFHVEVEGFTGEITGVADLTATFRTIHQQPGFDGDTPVVIIAGEDVPWDHVVAVWNAALAAGSRRIAFGER